MADQVHRREKQMKRELLQWREDWRGVLSMDPAEALENLPDGPAKHTSADRESPPGQQGCHAGGQGGQHPCRSSG